MSTPPDPRSAPTIGTRLKFWPWLWLRPRDEAAPGTTLEEATANVDTARKHPDAVQTSAVALSQPSLEGSQK